MNLTLVALLCAAGLFVGMLLLFEAGRRIGMRRMSRDPQGATKGAGPVEAAVFGLLGLLLAFTFSGAAARFEARRHLITEEANAMGTAYLRLDMLPSEAQPHLRELFRRYTDARLETYRNVADTATTRARHSRALKLQEEIWKEATAACRRTDAPLQAAVVLLPALNQMFDIVTVRTIAAQNHPPRIILALLAGLSLLSALLIGYLMCESRQRSWLHMLILAMTLALTYYVIVDLEYPRLGLIRIDAADQVLMEVRQSMGPE